MDLRTANDSKSRFEGLVSVIGHADRAGPLRDYCVGLMLPCERKSVEPMAAMTAPERTAAQHQSLLHTVKLSSFGSFVVRKKGQRIGRNPKTGKEVPIPPRRVMVFKPSTIFKQRINYR